MLRIKLKAGALQMTLFLIVVVALLLTAFMILVQTQKLFKTQTDLIIETVHNSNKGIHYALNHTIKPEDTITINLEDEDYKSLSVHRTFWGTYEKVISTSKIKVNALKKVALIGASQNNVDRSALYLQDNNRPLILVGNTKIEGLSYLPVQGVKSGTIAGQSYYGTSLIYGPTRTSSTLPKLAFEMIDRLKHLNTLVSNILSEDHIVISPNSSYSNSFFNSTKLIHANTAIHLSQIKLAGNIIIHSNSKIIVDPSANLNDVLLIAPEIVIKDNVKGNFQAIASKNILAGKYIDLQYPSALVVMENEAHLEAGKLNQLKVDTDTSIKGQVIFLGNQKSTNYKAQVIIEDDAMITGELYCDGNLELKGTVNGGVFANNFVANQSGSVYQNHIYNAEISTNTLPEEYIGLMFNNSKKGVLKWLY